MRKFPADRLGVVQGSRMLFSDYVDGGPMWTGQGDRECRHLVCFKEPFLEAPVVQIGIGLWDMDHKHNLRADIGVENVTREGFEIVFRTWGDSRIARLRADWTAFGPVRDEDSWDVV